MPMNSSEAMPAAEMSPAHAARAGIHSAWKTWRKQTIVVAILIVLSLVGLGLEDVSPANTYWYWLSVVPLFGVICLLMSRHRFAVQHADAARPPRLWPQVQAQIFHWLGILIALKIMVVLFNYNILSGNASGPVALLLLGSGSYYAGLRFHRLFLIVGILLGLIALVAGYVEKLEWIIAIALGLTVVGVLLFKHWMTRESLPVNARAKETTAAGTGKPD